MKISSSGMLIVKMTSVWDRSNVFKSVNSFCTKSNCPWLTIERVDLYGVDEVIKIDFAYFWVGVALTVNAKSVVQLLAYGGGTDSCWGAKNSSSPFEILRIFSDSSILLVGEKKAAFL